MPGFVISRPDHGDEKRFYYFETEIGGICSFKALRRFLRCVLLKLS